MLRRHNNLPIPQTGTRLQQTYDTYKLFAIVCFSSTEYHLYHNRHTTISKCLNMLQTIPFVNASQQNYLFCLTAHDTASSQYFTQYVENWRINPTGSCPHHLASWCMGRRPLSCTLVPLAFPRVTPLVAQPSAGPPSNLPTGAVVQCSQLPARTCSHCYLPQGGSPHTHPKQLQRAQRVQ